MWQASELELKSGYSGVIAGLSPNDNGLHPEIPRDSKSISEDRFTNLTVK